MGSKSKMIDCISTSNVIFRISGPALHELEKLIFSRHPEREWGTFFTFGFRLTSWGYALSFVELLVPQAGDLDRNSNIVEIRSSYTSRAMDRVGDCKLGIGVIHSHPLGWGTTPSFSDDEMDCYYGTDLFSGYGIGVDRPYCSLIANRDNDGSFEFSGRVFVKGHWLEVSDLLIVGDNLERICSYRKQIPTGNQVALNESTTARLESLLGSSSQERLRNSTVGVIGCSGTGSPAIEALVRAGVGNMIIVDPQRLSPSNLERIHGSTLEDVSSNLPPFKVELMVRLAREINPDCRVTGIVGNVLDEEVRDELLRCDLILGCSDTYHARAALGDLNALYLIPSLDVGVQMDGANGKVHSQIAEVLRLSPNQPCPFCLDRISTVMLNQELMDDESRTLRRQSAEDAREKGMEPDVYWIDEPQLHTIGYLTTIVGAMAAGYAIGWLTDTFRMPDNRFQFDITKPNFAFANVLGSRKPDCSCGTKQGYSDQGRDYLSVTKPLEWPIPQFISTA